MIINAVATSLVIVVGFFQEVEQHNSEEHGEFCSFVIDNSFLTVNQLFLSIHRVLFCLK